MTNDDHRSRAIDELSALVLRLLDPSPLRHNHSPHPHRHQRVSPTGFATLLLGASLAMMLCGSVTFLIGFLLMPWVLVVLVTLYFLGVVSAISEFGRAMLSPPPCGRLPTDEMSGPTKCQGWTATI